MSADDDERRDQMRRFAARLNVGSWLAAERSYGNAKWGEGDNRATAVAHMAGDPTGEWWRDYVAAYLHRAGVLGLDTPLGRQAWGKAIVTAIHALETALEVHGGELPEPGHPSGEVRPWPR